MTTLGQRWQTVVPLTDGWVGCTTFGQHHRVLDENWKSVPFLLALQRIGPKLGQHKQLCRSQKLVEQHRANVGPLLY